MDYIQKIKQFINQNLSKTGNIFDNFIHEFELCIETPHNMQELKQKYDKKYIGDLFVFTRIDSYRLKRSFLLSIH